jgi:hypothetical protein
MLLSGFEVDGEVRVNGDDVFVARIEASTRDHLFSSKARLVPG